MTLAARQMRGDVGTKYLPWNGRPLWGVQTQVAGECCWARNVVILDRYADASGAERRTRGYVSNKGTSGKGSIFKMRGFAINAMKPCWTSLVERDVVLRVLSSAL